MKSYTNKNIVYNEIYLNKELLPSPYEAFSEEKNKILNSNHDYRQEEIQNERILYFKKLGINLGDNYDNYINKEILQLFPNTETIEIFSQIRKNLYIEMRDEYYKSLPEYIKNREKINKLELL